jgi:hypothetical protein
MPVLITYLPLKTGEEKNINRTPVQLIKWIILYFTLICLPRSLYAQPSFNNDLKRLQVLVEHAIKIPESMKKNGADELLLINLELTQGRIIRYATLQNTHSPLKFVSDTIQQTILQSWKTDILFTGNICIPVAVYFEKDTPPSASFSLWTTYFFKKDISRTEDLITLPGILHVVYNRKLAANERP